MSNYVQILIFVIIGVVLLWFGYNLFMGQLTAMHRNTKNRTQRRKVRATASADNNQACPLCSTRLYEDDLIKTLAFPSVTGGRDRLMYIRGCVYCLTEDLARNCPVCGAALGEEEVLIARMFERPLRRPHVHVLGCTRCRKLGLA